MAHTWYPKTKTKILKGQLDLSALNLKVVLVDLADYTYSAAHDFLDDVPVGARVATSGNLANKTITEVGDDSVLDADDIVLAAVTGDQSEALILYNDSPAGDGNKHLLAIIGNFTVGMPVTPNGSDVTVSWATAASGGILKF